jgi:hypothetical protein
MRSSASPTPVRVVLGVLFTSAIILACGSSETSLFGDPTGDGTSGGTSSGTSGEGSSGVFNPNGDGGTSGDDDGGLKACATETKKAERLPLDLYLMVDTSGSMSGTVAGGGTKWEAVRTALKGFIADPKSAGLGVGLQYFPKIVNAAAPTTCGTDAACGAYSPCIRNKACTKAPLKFCTTDADCPGAKCEDLGSCPNSPGYACVRTAFNCPTGPCSYFTFSYCSGRDSCTATDYATPAVAIGKLPGAGNAQQTALTASLDARTVDGFTPTHPSLQGAVDAAKAYAVANPTHVVVAVYVTDGFPTECTVQDIPTIATVAGAAKSGTPSIKTFVIGVFSNDEQTQATTNLNQIATAGGTNPAFIISTTSNVTQQFQAALDKIRGSSLPCEYTLPKPTTGTPDYEKVNVQVTSGAGAKSLLPLAGANASACTAAGGWYYDVDPKTGGTPTKVIICPSSCTSLNADPNAQIDVLLGCKTVTTVPK